MSNPEQNCAARVAVVILTFNEERHLARCIKSVKPFASEVFVIDSLSTDQTAALAAEHGATVLCNKWENNHARQFNWGLNHAPITADWVMRLDADEYITPELAAEIARKLSCLSSNVTGVYVRRRIHFLGKWMRHGGTYPMWVLRLWRSGLGQCENRWMDEHIKLSHGQTVRFEHDLVDDNLNDLTWWTNKHNHYATREAVDLLNLRYRFMPFDERTGDKEQVAVKRWLKEAVYSRVPLFLRPLMYFIYRYIFRLGFLDGKQGLIWNVLQGFWYRFLVDAKVAQAEQYIVGDATKAQHYVHDVLRLK